MNCPTDKTWYVEARVGSERHRGEWPSASLIRILDRIAPPPAGQGGK